MEEEDEVWAPCLKEPLALKDGTCKCLSPLPSPDINSPNTLHSLSLGGLGDLLKMVDAEKRGDEDGVGRASPCGDDTLRSMPGRDWGGS